MAELSPSLAVGRSTHTLPEVARAVNEEIDYLAFGPVFGTRSKDSPYDERGLPLLRKVAAEVAPLPLIAIGGIDAWNVDGVMASGASGVAVISAVAAAEDPVAATRTLVERMAGCAVGGGPEHG